MAKFALILLAVATVASAYGKPMGIGGVGVSKAIHSSHVGISPYMGYGLGYGMMGYPMIGKSIGVTHYHKSLGPQLTGLGLGLASLGGVGIKAGLLAKGAGYGLAGLGMAGMYPGGIGLGYGLKMMG